MVFHVVAIDVMIFDNQALTLEILGVTLNIPKLAECLGRARQHRPFELQMLCESLRLERNELD